MLSGSEACSWRWWRLTASAGNHQRQDDQWNDTLQPMLHLQVHSFSPGVGQQSWLTLSNLLYPGVMEPDFTPPAPCRCSRSHRSHLQSSKLRARPQQDPDLTGPFRYPWRELLRDSSVPARERCQENECDEIDPTSPTIDPSGSRHVALSGESSRDDHFAQSCEDQKRRAQKKLIGASHVVHIG